MALNLTRAANVWYRSHGLSSQFLCFQNSDEIGAGTLTSGFASCCKLGSVEFGAGFAQQT